MNPSAALAGICVVDISGSVSTAYCGKLFADYGAQVINLEPEAGFSTRSLAPFLAPRDGIDGLDQAVSAMHAYLNTNKSSVIREAMSSTALEQLLGGADLILDDGQSIECAGLDAALKQTRAMCHSISWFGSTGPYADFHGSDALCFALNGMLRTIGTVDGPPIIPTGYQAQIIGGMSAYIASLSQILGRELGNLEAAVHLETNIFEAMLCFTDVGAITSLSTGIEVPRMGINRYPPTYPLGVFPCRDGWIGLTVLTPSQWHSFCDLLQMPDFADVNMFQSAIGRLEAADVIEPLVCERLLQCSSEELFYRAQRAGVPLARVPTLEEVFEVDQFVQRNAFSEAQLPQGKVLTVPSVPFRLFATPPNFGGPVAALGQQTQDYL